MGLAVDLHDIAPAPRNQHLAQSRPEIGALGVASLERRIDAGHRVAVGPGAGHEDEIAPGGRHAGAGDAAEANPAQDRLPDGARHRRRGLGEADLRRQHVGGAERHDRQRQGRQGRRPPRRDQPVDHLVDGAVAAGRDHQIGRVGSDVPGERRGVARRLGRTQGEVVPVALQQLERGPEARAPAAAGHRIVDHQQASMSLRPRRRVAHGRSGMGPTISSGSRRSSNQLKRQSRCAPVTRPVAPTLAIGSPWRNI